MKLSKIAALFMVPVLALCLVACSAPGGNASESASSDPKIAELTAQKPANADEAAELYTKLMQKENEIFSSDNALWEKVFLAANKDMPMIEDGSNYGDFLKAKEFQQKRDHAEWKKGPTDDLVSMQTGIFGYKGHVHYHAAPCLDEYLDSLDPDMPKQDIYNKVAAYMDEQLSFQANQEPHSCPDRDGSS